MKSKIIKRDSNEVSLKDAIRKLLDIYKLTPKIQEAKLRASWGKMMGKSIANRTLELGLRDGKLYIRISSASLREEMALSKEKIKTIINEEMGEEIVTEIILT
jgi:predicted nucleic acid-binding Zn ribbon protein